MVQEIGLGEFCVEMSFTGTKSQFPMRLRFGACKRHFNRSQSHRAPLGCDGKEDSNPVRTVKQPRKIAECHLRTMDSYFERVNPKSCQINDIN